MASAWGFSFGSSFGSSFGVVTPPPAYLLPRPEGYSFDDWGSRVTETFAGFGVASPPDESGWKEWGHSMFYEPALCAMNIPSPEGFPDWQAWAEQFADSVR